METKMNAAALRSHQPSAASRQFKNKLVRNEIYIVLDNVLDTYNIGSIFRLADAVSAKKVYLCGGSATPPNARIKKASINTTEWVEWEYAGSTLELIRNLKFKIKNLKFIAIEQSSRSIQYNKFGYKMPVCLIVGNETSGVSKEALEMADAVVEIPMYGVNISLNVMVSLGIVLYQVMSSSR
ncbi:TrmH family RNA methyltransferase [Candidatus Daviesbacteria bacterium]|nr:TrmH family RNA methyltransferase [Candidatus Daviesbacteria bacterium]